MKTSLKRRDYHSYYWKRGELILTILKAAGLVVFLAYFFYRSFWAVIPLSVVGGVYVVLMRHRKLEKCREELTLQFKECILSVSAALKAGYAVENAFLESREDIRLLFGEESMIYQELELIRRGLIINITLEEQLTDFAGRSDCEEIRQFAEIFSIAKRSGGNIPDIISTTAELIGQRIDIKQEMRTLLSGRQMEQNIMKLMPFGILLYVGCGYPRYFDMLYHNLQGVGIMTLCLVIYLAAYALGEHIMRQIIADVK